MVVWLTYRIIPITNYVIFTGDEIFGVVQLAKMGDIPQTTCSNAFWCVEFLDFGSNFTTVSS